MKKLISYSIAVVMLMLLTASVSYSYNVRFEGQWHNVSGAGVTGKAQTVFVKCDKNGAPISTTTYCKYEGFCTKIDTNGNLLIDATNNTGFIFEGIRGSEGQDNPDPKEGESIKQDERTDE
jgi:hypothetical protein